MTNFTTKAAVRDTDLRRVVLLAGAALIAGASWASSVFADTPIIQTHAISTYGNLKYPSPDFAHLDYVNPDAPKGGEFSTWFTGGFDNLNPYATQEGKPAYLSSSMFESVLQGTSDDVDGNYCYLCTSMEYPETKDWVIFHLRDDVVFSDGTPMTANDVVFSHNLMMEQATESYRFAVAQMVDSVEALDDYTVKFTFAADYPKQSVIEQVGGQPVFSLKWYEETGARLDESRLETGPGTGPYMVGSFEVNHQIIYVRNPNFWGADHPLNIGQNNFDSIRIEYFADTTAAFEGFKAGEFTFRQENSSLSWATSYDFPAIQNGWVVKETLPNGNVPGATGFVFNMKSGKFDDLRVRQALALMYNFTWTNEELQYGLFKQRESFWQNADLAARGVPEGRELELLQSVSSLIDPSILTDEVTVPHVSGESQLDRRNLRRALALMEEAGWVPGANGMLEKDGEPLKVEFLGYSPTFDRIILPYVDNLQKLGVDAEWNRIDPAQYTERTRNFDFDMIFDGYRVGPIEGEGLGQKFGSDGLGDVFNPAHYSNPAVDQLAESIKDVETYDDMVAHVRAIDRIMRRDLFVVPTWYLGDYWVAYYDMYEHPETLPPYALGEMSFWWYNAEKAEALKAAGALR
ncbi:MAG: ABC transporter substrate-binding protein [Marivivens sp.]|jgi:microcin C transport system substrate-binding protein|uniref:extracellular solute-binding protein n=1 Tax=Marivivens sp. TaxID=1978374 RepID=UPI00201F0832|nr:extracellular solute-binding protein [Marivivens sp.]MCL7405003.1 extracellular solute-binding protein [Marivivens geojensis]NBX08274.1 ABC transporter substrate-binding protein [Marivivens sp.]